MAVAAVDAVAVMAAARRRKVERVALPAGMVLVQVFTVLTMLMSKVALNAGMHPLVLLVYRNLVAASVVAPLALIFERGAIKHPGIAAGSTAVDLRPLQSSIRASPQAMWENVVKKGNGLIIHTKSNNSRSYFSCSSIKRDVWKKLNLVALGWISINATFGVLMAMGLYYCGLRVTSPAYAVNFLNLIPVATFLIAVALRAERVSLASWPGRTKLLGAVAAVAGTMVVSLCKGTHLLLPHIQQSSHASSIAVVIGGHNMVVGTLFLIGSCVSYALWFIVQARVATVFPSRYWATTLTCAAGSLQSATAAAVAVALSGASAEGGWSAWRLRWDMQLVTVVYSGVFNTAVTFVLVSWAVARRGPVYPPMFNSLSLVGTTVVDAVVLGTDVYLGGVLGAGLVVVGLYAFLWGKGKEFTAAKELELPLTTGGHT